MAVRRARGLRGTAERRRGGALAEVAGLFLRLGFTAFGGPAAHIAMMREEVVRRRRWLSEERFLDLLGLTHLIPGPNSTEMAIYLGYLRAGRPGLVVGGLCFILPAAVIVGALAAAYVAYGATPRGEWVLYGVKPVIIAVVLQALAGLARTALMSALAAAWAGAALALYLLGTHELVVLFAGGVAYAVAKTLRERRPRGGPARPGTAALVAATGHAVAGLGAGPGAGFATAGAAVAAQVAAAGAAAGAAPFSLPGLFAVFLKVGAVLYGSGYVLLAFLRRDLVERLGWLTDRELLDAVSVGQFTPGPLFTTATFVGYVLGGLRGAVLATAGIFLPSFVFVAAVHPVGAWLRRLPWTSAILDGVNLASLALMAGVTLELARSALVDAFTTGLAVLALVCLVRLRINSAWLVAAGALLGAAVRALSA